MYCISTGFIQDMLSSSEDEMVEIALMARCAVPSLTKIEILHLSCKILTKHGILARFLQAETSLARILQDNANLAR